MSTWSEITAFAAFAILLLGILAPGWDTARATKRVVKRRIYWTATIVAIIVLLLAGLPDLQNSIALAAAALVLAVGWAYFRTPNIKIGGRNLGRVPAKPRAGPAGTDPPLTSDAQMTRLLLCRRRQTSRPCCTRPSRPSPPSR
jgi:hypothetical protein